MMPSAGFAQTPLGYKGETMVLASMQRRLLRRVALAAVGLTLAILGGCGGGGNTLESSLLQPTPMAASQCGSVDAQKSWLGQYMRGAYYWTDNMPSADPAQYASVADYFEALRWVPTDHYSFTLSEQEYQALFQSGQEIGYGIYWKNDPAYANSASDPGPIRVAYVDANSPAAAAGVMRGDALVTVNGATPSSQAVLDLLYPTQTGTPITLELRATGASTSYTVSLTAATVTHDAVFETQTLTAANGSKVGYLVLNQFLAPNTTMPALRSTLHNFQQAGINDLVLDLRYNGGGYVSMANELSAMIAGNRVSTGNIFVRYYFNAKNSASNYSDAFIGVGSDTQLSLPRVFVLTSGRTASASELVINALKPYMTVVQLGSLTYGKPVGQIPVVNCSQMFAPIVFETTNAAGNGGYFSGIAPACSTVLDDLDHPLGATNEAVLGQALGYVNGGACPATIAAAQAKRSLATDGVVHPALPERVRNGGLLR